MPYTYAKLKYIVQGKDLTKLGSGMDRQETPTILYEGYDTLEEAKAAAERHFGQKIDWIEEARSYDLNTAIYTIRTV
jgi:hypothetical protein